MAFRVVLEAAAKKELAALDKPVQRRIAAFIDRLQELQDPTSTGHALTGPYMGLWTYRVGDMRLIAEIDRGRVVITVIKIGNRKEVY